MRVLITGGQASSDRISQSGTFSLAMRFAWLTISPLVR